MNEEFIIGAELSARPKETIALLISGSKDAAKVIEARQEFQELNRNIRNTQIDKTQKNKTVGGTNIPQSRIPVPFQKKIVTVATAFEAGEGVALSPNESNKLADEIIRLWRVNRLDSKLIDLLIAKKSETESAIVFYIDDIKPNTFFNRILGVNDKKEIKSSVLTSKGGIMSPFWDAKGDMKAFTWRYTFAKGDKKINYVEVYDDKNKYLLSDETGEMLLIETKPHGFGKIPVVYLSQDFTEWNDVSVMIDRFETALSKLADSNDYTGHPFLKLYGEVVSMPKKEDNGKTLRFPVKVLKDGKEVKGDAEFLTNNNGPESVKLELEKLEKLINYLTSTPQLSLEDLNGVGSGMSGVAIKLMFIDAIIKAKLNEGGNRTTVERMLNVLIAGTVNTTGISLKKMGDKTYFDVAFKNILPNDIKEIIDYLSTGVTAGFISKKTAIDKVGLTDNADEEMKLIAAEKAEAAALAPDAEKEPGEVEPPAEK